MSTARIRTGRPSEEGLLALIAGDGLREPIMKVLDAQQLEVASFQCVGALLDRDDAHTVSLVVVCIDDSGASVPEVLGSLARRFTSASVVVVCASIEPRAVRAMLTAGAAGVVLLEDVECALNPCLQAVRAGQVCLPRPSWRQLEPPILSAREKQVLALVVMGYMNSQIAEQLFLAESTVKSHLSSAFSKLGVRSRHEATARILDPGSGLGVGILALGGEPLEVVGVGAP